MAAPTEVSALFALALDRSLSEEEAELLRCLSACGMAKVNADLGREIPLDNTLAELLAVFRHLKARSRGASGRLSEAAKAFLGQLGVPCPAEVTVLATQVAMPTLLSRANQKIVEGEALTDALEE
eukprot:RCo039886